MRSRVWIALSNITMFRRYLALETDAQQHRALSDLFAKEEQSSASCGRRRSLSEHWAR
jgi:hypothetical protein